MKKLTKYLILLGLTPLLSGCLSNLNVSEFFRKLEAKNEEYYEIVTSNKTEIEELIKEELEDQTGENVEWITFWGESRYAYGDVVGYIGDSEYIISPGEYRLEGNEESFLYRAWFVPSEDDLVERIEIYYY